MWRSSAVVLLALLWATPAEAGPLAAAVATFTSWFGTLGFWAQFAIQIGAAFILTQIARLLAPKPRVPDQKRDLQLPRSRPPKRFVYGRNRTYGSPAPWRVKGDILYGCIILNSRPSAGGDIRIFMDKRQALSSTGNPFDFSGNGMVLDSIEDFPGFGAGDLSNPRVWIGLGDQTSPPAVFTDTASEFFQPTDGWRGCTVMWALLHAGENERRSDRWRAAPPEFEVEMDWSLVWDPRDTAQDPDDPETWQFSRNQSLVLLDTLRENPIRRYPLSQIHLPSFIEAADVADEPVLRYYASLDAGEDVFEPRYEANGIIIWTGGELLDQIEPVAEAGAGDILRIGGRVGYAAGEYRAPMFTVTDFTEENGIEYQVLRPGRELPVFVKGVYISPDRDWQEADLTPIEVEGASDTGVGDDAVFEIRMPFVTSPTQAMRVQQIIARKFAAQRTLSITLWPEAMDVVAGATISVDLPPGFARLNADWMVMSCNPALWVSEIQEDGAQEIAMRIPVTLRPNPASIYEWSPEDDEQEILFVAFDPTRPLFLPPQNLSVTTGAGVSTGTQARLRIDFDATAGADLYEIFLREQGQSYALVSTTEATTNNLLNVVSGLAYDVRVRAISQPVNASERRSDFAEVLGTLASPDSMDMPPPTDGVATGGLQAITVTFTAPNSPFYAGMEFWGSDTDDSGAATLLATQFGSAGEPKTFTETGLGDDQTRFYFAVALGSLGRRSDFTASVSATTDP